MTGFQGIRHDSEQSSCILRSPSIYPATTLATPPPPTKVAAMNSFAYSEATIGSSMTYPRPADEGSPFNWLKVLWSSASVTKSFCKCLVIYTNEPTDHDAKEFLINGSGCLSVGGGVSPLRCWQVIYNAWTLNHNASFCVRSDRMKAKKESSVSHDADKFKS